MEEQILRSETIYNGRLVNLQRHTVRLPNGKESQREVIQHPGAVAIVALDEQNRILLVRQFRLPAGQILLEVPAGTLESGEDPLDCARRELREETGYLPHRLQALGGIYVAPGYTTEYIHLFLAGDLEHAPLPGDHDEFVEVERLTLDDLLNLIDRGEIVDAKTIASVLLVARRLQ